MGNEYESITPVIQILGKSMSDLISFIACLYNNMDGACLTIHSYVFYVNKQGILYCLDPNQDQNSCETKVRFHVPTFSQIREK